MTDNINPSHYKDGPFECIELSRLLSSDWGKPSNTASGGSTRTVSKT